MTPTGNTRLTVEHNLTDDQLRKALSGMAVASGIEPEVIETLTKACACDNTPKEPRTKAMRLLFHMMQQEYWQAARDIERYARMINKGELEKATSHSPLTADQLRQLQQAINDRFAFVAGQIQSVDYQPAPDLLERWKHLGLVEPGITPETFMASVPAEMYFVRNAFLMGKFIEAVEAGKTYQEVMQMALHAPILAPDLHAIAVAEQQTANFITNNAADLATEAGKLWAKKQAETVRSMAIDFHARKLNRTVLDRKEKQMQGIATPDRPVETWRQFSSELHHTMTDRSRDWDRVAFYELTDAQKQGMAHKLLQDGNVDKLVYKRPMPDACAQCKHVFLQKDGRTPKLFKLSKLIQNGTNIGRKPHPVRGGKVAPGGRKDGDETIKAVAGLVHPWCACAGPYEYTGYEPWAKEKKK